LNLFQLSESGLYAGFAKIDITPDYTVGLSGYSDPESRRHEAVEERVYSTCIALSDGAETILLYTVDSCGINHGIAEKMRNALKEAIGIDGEKVFCAATHGHNCPAFFGYPEAEQYIQQFLDAVVEGARRALEDRAPATIQATSAGFPGKNFVRHVVTANGKVLSSSVKATPDNPAVRYVTTPDSRMGLVKFVREGLKKDILLVNWQAHPDQAREIGYYRLCCGYPGPLRDVLGALSGCLVAYFTGADGNTSHNSRIPADRHTMTWREYANQMAQLAYGAMKDLKPVEGKGIVTMRRFVEAEVDHSWDPMLKEANEVYELWKSTDKPTGDALGRKYNFSSVYQARAIRSRAAKGKSDLLEINAFRVGGIGFTTGTYEMFSDAGIFVKTKSPYAVTVLLTGNSGYIPSDSAFNYRCYEADTGMYARGVAENLANQYVEMLKEIQEKQEL